MIKSVSNSPNQAVCQNNLSKFFILINFPEKFQSGCQSVRGTIRQIRNGSGRFRRKFQPSRYHGLPKLRADLPTPYQRTQPNPNPGRNGRISGTSNQDLLELMTLSKAIHMVLHVCPKSGNTVRCWFETAAALYVALSWVWVKIYLFLSSFRNPIRTCFSQLTL